MAMTYQNFASLGVNLNRQKYGPLDISNVFTSAADLKYYLTKGTFTEGVSEYWYKNANEKIVPYPYEGQVLATVIDGVVEVYVLALDADGNFETREIGAKVEADGKTIKVNAEGKLELVGLPADIAGKTLVPSLVNGELTWAEPDTSTAEGQAQEIEGLKTRATNLETATANNAAAIAKEASDRAAAIGVKASEGVEATGVYAEIASALQAAKDYADAQDADTIYDDTALAGRVKAIEDDYLKAADRYNDAELRAAITAIDEVVGDAEGGLVKDVAANAQAIAAEKLRAEAAEKVLGERIDAIDFVDPTELAEAVAGGVTEAKGYTDAEIDKIEAAIAALNHFKAEVVDSVDKVTEVGVLYLIKDESVAGVDKYNEYIVIDGVATHIGDTTTDLSNYYNKTEIDGKVEAINTAISNEVTAREALAEKVTALEGVDNATQAEFDQFKADVAEDITEAKQAAIADADGKLANKVNTSDFEQFKTANTQAIADAKQAAINAAAEAEEAKGYAVATEVASVYATKADFEAHKTASESAYAKAESVNAELAKKIETGSIAHSTDSVAEGVTVEGTKLNIVVDAYTKEETLTKIDEKITSFTGGESAKDVLNALNTYKETNNARVGAIETEQDTQNTAIAAAQAKADKAEGDAAAVAADLVTANAAIAENTREIGVAKSSIESVNNTLTKKVTALENKDAGFDSAIKALQTTVSGTDGHASRISALEGDVTALKAKDTELAGQIATKANAADVYTKGEVDTKVAEAVGAVDLTPYAKTADVNKSVEDINAAIALKADASAVYTKEDADGKFQTEAQVDARINALIVAADPEGGKTIENIQNLVKFVDENAGDVAELISTVGGHTTTISEHTQRLSEIDAAIVALVQPKASAEISVANDGTLGILGMSTDKLVQGSMTLVLNGGDAGETAIEA